MAHPQVADGVEGLQVWRKAENILNKKSRTEEKAWGSSLGVGRGVNSSKISLLRNITTSLGPGRKPWIKDVKQK
jgi:hypothetical protein